MVNVRQIDQLQFSIFKIGCHGTETTNALFHQKSSQNWQNVSFAKYRSLKNRKLFEVLVAI